MVSPEEKIEAQAYEIQQLRAQLARVVVHDSAPSLPPLSTPGIDEALQKERMAQWMRIMLANLWVYVSFRACGMGKIERPTEF